MAGEDGFSGLVSTIADYLSVISAVTSTFALIGINRMRRELTTRSLLPNIVETLTENNSNISGCFPDFERRQEDFSNEIVKCKASLRPIAQLKSDAGKDARLILELISAYEQKDSWYSRFMQPKPQGIDDNKKKARKIYQEINGLIEEVKRLMIEHRIGG